LTFEEYLSIRYELNVIVLSLKTGLNSATLEVASTKVASANSNGQIFFLGCPDSVSYIWNVHKQRIEIDLMQQIQFARWVTNEFICFAATTADNQSIFAWEVNSNKCPMEIIAIGKQENRALESELKGHWLIFNGKQFSYSDNTDPI
jgi:WD40 repeat protein